MANKFQGVSASSTHLSVHWRAERGTTFRFETLKIPWTDLVTDQDLMDRLYAAVAKNLRETWGETGDDHPLF